MTTLQGHAKVNSVVGAYHDEINKIETQIHSLMKKKAELVMGAKHELKAAGIDFSEFQAAHAGAHKH